MEKNFGYSSSALSEIIKTVTNIISKKHEKLLHNLMNLNWLNKNKSQEYAPVKYKYYAGNMYKKKKKFRKYEKRVQHCQTVGHL